MNDLATIWGSTKWICHKWTQTVLHLDRRNCHLSTDCVFRSYGKTQRNMASTVEHARDTHKWRDCDVRTYVTYLTYWRRRECTIVSTIVRLFHLNAQTRKQARACAHTQLHAHTRMHARMYARTSVARNKRPIKDNNMKVISQIINTDNTYTS